MNEDADAFGEAMGSGSFGRLTPFDDERRWRVIWQREGDTPQTDTSEAKRARMVETQLRGREIVSPAVLRALGKVPRHLFVRPEDEEHAYEDRPLYIGEGQTISQPYMVALMTQLLHPAPHHRVLEIGTGSGYQAAVLSELVAEVYSIELSETLAQTAAQRLALLGYANVRVRCGDGHGGWPECAPYDGIIVTCAAAELPRSLPAQLIDGGRLVIPIGPRDGLQTLWVIQRRGAHLQSHHFGRVAFVPFRRQGE